MLVGCLLLKDLVCQGSLPQACDPALPAVSALSHWVTIRAVVVVQAVVVEHQGSVRPSRMRLVSRTPSTGLEGSVQQLASCLGISTYMSLRAHQLLK